MPHADFVHLRVHTAYSLAEGAIPISRLIAFAETNEMPAIALTDTSNMFGALEFSVAAINAGIQPIIGCQLLFEYKYQGSANNHSIDDKITIGPLILIAQNKEGYKNLLQLLKCAYIDSADPNQPNINLSQLSMHANGILILTGGANGPIGQLIQLGHISEAETLLLQLKKMFQDRLYVEIQRHGVAEEVLTETYFLKWAYSHKIPIVATNESFFLNPDDYHAHDALLCIAEGTYISESDRRRVSKEHYLKSSDEMKKIFNDIPEAVKNSLVIAKRCSFAPKEVPPLLPQYDCGLNKNEADELKLQALNGLKMRLEKTNLFNDLSEKERKLAIVPYFDRLNYELNVVIEMGYSGYFLIVSDFIRWAKQKKIPVGPGRGSGAGSLVAWALTITELNPLRWGLLFERFLNPERVSLPDFDIDFCQERRDEVIQYVQNKYGRDRVAQIITFGKLQARAVLRDVGRVLQMPYGYVDKICKLLPNNPANPVTLQEGIDQEPLLREMMANDTTVQNQINIALKLEGLLRHASTHAAGVVIADRPLEELIPIYRDGRSEMPVSGFNMKSVENAGLIKFDFLGLKTLTVLSTAINLIRENGININLSDIPLNNDATFHMIARGETTGIFQLESAGMRDVLRNMKPDTFEDIIAVVALYRPGPMDNIPSYIRRKHGKEEIDYLHPSLESILKETFGIIIYQEQVMQIAQELSGYSLGNADLLRRAMGKKIQSEMTSQRKIFIEGAENRGVNHQKASYIFDLVDKFAGYGFNKSHAAAYALLAYQTAYLKANYPIEFLAASMTLEINNTEKINVFRQELDRLGILLLPPDVNESLAIFTVEESAIRYSLAALKNVGDGAIGKLVEERERGGLFIDISDFSNRMDPHSLNKRQLESLIRAGAFDTLEANRLRLFNSIEQILNIASSAESERTSNQIGLFSNQGIKTKVVLSNLDDWAPLERLKHEFDAIGFYLSAHPLDAYTKTLEYMSVNSSAEIMSEKKLNTSKLAGTLIGKKERTSAKGNRYAFLQFSDPSGVFEATCFSEILSEFREQLNIGSSFIIRSSISYESEQPRIVINRLEPLEQAADCVDLGLKIWIDRIEPVGSLRDILSRQGEGKGSITLITKLTATQEVEINLGETFRVSPELLLAVKTIPGVTDAREI